jgi:hypothetical protein
MKKWMLIFCLLTVVYCNAQENSDRTSQPAPKSFFTTIVIRDILRDYNIGYATKIAPTHTIEARIGWVHRNRIVSRYYEQYLLSTDWKCQGPSFYVQLNKWKYGEAFSKPVVWFYGVYSGYRYVYFTDEKIPLGGRDHSESDEELTLSQWRNDILLLGSIGMKVSGYSTSEISLGVRLSWTHTNVSATRFYPSPAGTAEYETYKEEQAAKIPGAKGFSIVPVIRFSSRLGIFKW